MSAEAESKRQKTARRWGPRMILILIAMLAVSMAFIAGLMVQGGLPPIPSLIGGIAVFLTLYGTLPRPKAPTSPNQKSGQDQIDVQARLAIFENEIVKLAVQLEQFQNLSQKIGKFDELAPTLQNLHGYLDEIKHHNANMAAEQGAESDQRFAELSNKLQQLDGRINGLNEETETTEKDEPQQDQLQTQITELARLVQQMAAMDKNKSSSNNFAPEPGDVLQGQNESTVNEVRKEVLKSEKPPLPAPKESQAKPEAWDAPREAHATFDGDEKKILSVVSKAIKERRMEVFLQPVVQLPKRKTVYYEVFTRLRTKNNSLILPNIFVPVAERAGLMPLIDNMMLLRAIKIIRQMDRHTSAKGLFCTLSTQSLVDPDFFPKLLNFLENNRDLAGRIIFEISQAQKISAGPIEREAMQRLAKLGFCYSLDKVIDLDIDYNELARREFKFVRISADRLINGMADLGARIHGADKADYLERFGMKLIVERVETEQELTTLADYNIKLGQGYLFAEPRPVRPEILGEKAA